MQIDFDQLKAKFPDFKFCSEKNSFVGEIKLEGNDKYYLELKIPESNVFFPKVFETDERIPRKPNRHVNEDYTLCFTTQAKAQIYLKSKPARLSSFIEDIIIPYLNHNSYYEINKKYRQEYSHGTNGIIEGYMDILKIQDVFKIANLMLERIKGRKLKFRELCYCGSNIFKKCNSALHVKAYREFRFIEKNTLAFDLEYCFIPLIKELERRKSFSISL